MRAGGGSYGAVEMAGDIVDMIARHQLSHIVRPEELDPRNLDDGVIRQNTLYDMIAGNPVVYNSLAGLKEILGIAPSQRLVDRIRDMSSPVLAPQTAFGWGDAIAGTAADAINTALGAADIFGIVKAVAPAARSVSKMADEEFVRKMVRRSI